MSARAWFEDADRHFVVAVQRVMTASLSDAPSIAVEKQIDWTSFERELARLNEYARLRHAAKHAATLEAIYSIEPVTIHVGAALPSVGDTE